MKPRNGTALGDENNKAAALCRPACVRWQAELLEYASLTRWPGIVDSALMTDYWLPITNHHLPITIYQSPNHQPLDFFPALLYPARHERVLE
jgi:hypothetical protein